MIFLIDWMFYVYILPIELFFSNRFYFFFVISVVNKFCMSPSVYYVLFDFFSPKKQKTKLKLKALFQKFNSRLSYRLISIYSNRIYPGKKKVFPFCTLPVRSSSQKETTPKLPLYSFIFCTKQKKINTKKSIEGPTDR